MNPLAADSVALGGLTVGGGCAAAGWAAAARLAAMAAATSIWVAVMAGGGWRHQGWVALEVAAGGQRRWVLDLLASLAVVHR